MRFVGTEPVENSLAGSQQEALGARMQTTCTPDGRADLGRQETRHQPPRAALYTKPIKSALPAPFAPPLSQGHKPQRRHTTTATTHCKHSARGAQGVSHRAEAYGASEGARQTQDNGAPPKPKPTRACPTKSSSARGAVGPEVALAAAQTPGQGAQGRAALIPRHTRQGEATGQAPPTGITPPNGRLPARAIERVSGRGRGPQSAGLLAPGPTSTDARTKQISGRKHPPSIPACAPPTLRLSQASFPRQPNRNVHARPGGCLRLSSAAGSHGGAPLGWLQPAQRWAPPTQIAWRGAACEQLCRRDLRLSTWRPAVSNARTAQGPYPLNAPLKPP
jgi:hypothetical protein